MTMARLPRGWKTTNLRLGEDGRSVMADLEITRLAKIWFVIRSIATGHIKVTLHHGL
jgi:hypothetical protein